MGPCGPSGAAVSRGETQDLAGHPAAVHGAAGTAAGAAGASKMARARIRKADELAGTLAGNWLCAGHAGASDRSGGAFVTGGAAVAAFARAAGRRGDAVPVGSAASFPGLEDRGFRPRAASVPLDVPKVAVKGSHSGTVAGKHSHEAENAAGARSSRRNPEAAGRGLGEPCSLERADWRLRADYGDSGA